VGYWKEWHSASRQQLVCWRTVYSCLLVLGVLLLPLLLPLRLL